MYSGQYTPEQVISELRNFGLELFVGNDGVVHGRFKERGKKMTLEMRAVADEIQGLNDEVAALLRAESKPGRRVYTGITVEEARAIGEQVNAGALELEGPVIYHQQTGLCDLTVREVLDG